MPDGKAAYHNGRKLQQHIYSKITVTTDFTPYYYGFFLGAFAIAYCIDPFYF